MGSETGKVSSLAEKISLKKKPTILSSIFKRGLLKKLSGLKKGCIVVYDGDESFQFGSPESSLKTEVTVLSQEFYVLTGSGGALGAAEAYIAGLWTSTDLVALNRIFIQNIDIMNGLEGGLARLFSPINKFIHYQRQNTVSGSKKNIVAHYDLSNDFYKLWLDETLTYSCAFFKTEGTSLKDASIEKLDRLCRKLHLKPEDKVLEIGSGWGSFSIHAASTYGCHVTTTTISDAQYEYVKSIIKEKDLEDKITLLRQDYRHLEGEFDKIVSIEMIEAVGHNFIPEYFKKASSLLKNDGLFALQGITYNDQGFDEYKSSVDYIKKYIFPGSCLVSVAQISDTVKKSTDLSIAHLEDITMHYVNTLKIWRKNFVNASKKVKNLGFSDEFLRMWIFYLVYCEAGFAERHIGDFQFVFAKPGLKNLRIEY